MGMYTELSLWVRLKSSTPDDVMTILKYMKLYEPECENGLPQVVKEAVERQNHVLFKTDRWPFMLRCSSCYFDAEPAGYVNQTDNPREKNFGTISDLKNYSGEIEAFVDWILPYVDAYDEDHLGYERYEECTFPTLIFYNSDKDKIYYNCEAGKFLPYKDVFNEDHYQHLTQEQ